MAEQSAIPEAAIQHLKANPELAGDFESKYGVSASEYLAPDDASATAAEVLAAEKAPDPETTPEAEEAPEGDSPSIAADVATGVASGPVNAFEEIGDLVTAGVNALGNIPSHVKIDTENPDEPLVSLLTTAEHDALLKENPDAVSVFGDSEESDAADNLGLPETETIFGGLAEGMSQFLTGYATGTKLARDAGWVAKSGIEFIRPLVIGGAVDFAAFDEHEQRLSDLIVEQFPEDAPIIFKYLQSDSADSFVEGRIKNVIEGGGLGLAVDGVTRLLRSWRGAHKARAAGNDVLAETHIREMDDTLNKAGQAVEEELPVEQQMDLFNNLPRQDTPDSLSNAAVSKVGDQTSLPEGRPLDAEDHLKFEENLDAADAVGSPIAEALGWGGRELTDFQTRLDRVFAEDISINEAFDDIPINLKHFTSEEAQKALAALTDAVSARMPAEWNSIQKWSAAAKSGEALLGQDPGQVIRRLAGRSEDSATLPGEIIAYRILESGMAENLVQMHRAARPQEELDQAAALFLSITTDVKHLQGNVARSLNVMKMDVSASDQLVGRLRTALEEASGDPSILRTRLNDLSKRPGWVRRAYGAVAQARAWDVVNEVWINSILSGPRTHAVNMTSNLLQANLMVAEQGAGALLRGDLRGVQHSGVQVAQQWMAWGDALKAARQAFKQGDNILDPFHKINDTGRTNAAIHNGEGGAVDLMGNVFRLPMRALGSEDEFFKQINYRSKVYADAWSEAKTKRLTGQERADFIADRLQAAYTETGRANATTQWGRRALQYAQEATFTNELGPLGSRVQGLVVNHPWLRQVAPFIRTPTNLLKQAGSRTPLRLFTNKFYQDLRSTDPTIRSRAIGQQVTGMAVGASVMMLASEGRISGGGPKDPSMRGNLMATGWMPYSIKVGDQWFEYKRYEPVATLFGVLADLSEVSAELNGRRYEELANMATAEIMKDIYEAADEGLLSQTAHATVKTISEKSYLQGIFDVLEAMNADDASYFERLGNQRAGTAVPFAMLQSQTNPEKYMRETRSALDEVRKTVWWLGEDSAEAIGLPGRLPRKYDALGQPVVKLSQPWPLPVAGPGKISEQQNNVLREEISKLAASPKASTRGSVSPPPENKGNVPLPEFTNREGKDAYERYNELIGRVENKDGQTLPEVLHELVTSDAYQNPELGRNTRFPDGTAYEGIRGDLVSKVIRGFRKAAWGVLISESYKSESGLSLKDAWINDERNKVLNKGGQLDLEANPIQ